MGIIGIGSPAYLEVKINLYYVTSRIFMSPQSGVCSGWGDIFFLVGILLNHALSSEPVDGF